VLGLLVGFEEITVTQIDYGSLENHLCLQNCTHMRQLVPKFSAFRGSATRSIKVSRCVCKDCLPARVSRSVAKHKELSNARQSITLI
jgi:hypothetical protein